MQDAPNAAERNRTLLQNTKFLAIGRAGSKLLVFLFVRLYTHVLTEEEYGIADLITGLSNFIIPLACAGLSAGFFRFAVDAVQRKKSVSCLTSGLVLLLASSAVFVALSPLISFVPYVSQYVWLIVVYTLSANLHYLVSEYVRAQGAYRLFSAQGILNTLLNIGFNLLFLLPLHLGVTGYVLSIVCADFCTTLFLFFRCRLWRVISLRVTDRALMRDMLRYCLPLIPASLCWWITNVSDRYMVTWLYGEAENGLYAAAYKIPNLLTIACNIFLDAWQFSAISERLAGDENKSADGMPSGALSAFFATVFRRYGAVLYFGTAGLILFSRVISLLLFDVKFESAWRYVPFLLLATLLSTQSSFMGTVYQVCRRSVPTLLTSLCGAAVNIVLNLWLIPEYGGLGAAVATVLSYGLCLVIRLLDTRRYLVFSVRPLVLCLNVGLLTAMAYCITAETAGWQFICGGIFLLSGALNLPDVYRGVVALRKGR